MPDVPSRGLDVSTEELRFLRRAFRRFALPYLVAMGLLAVAGWWRGGGAGAPDLEALHQEIAGLRATLAGLEGRLEATADQADTARKGLAALQAQEGDGDAEASLGRLERRLGDVAGRLGKLEKQPRPAGDLHARIDALSDRIGRVEQRASAPTPARSEVPPAQPAPPTAAPSH